MSKRIDRNSKKKENVEGETKISTKEYTIQIGDTFWKIAEKELGSGSRWQSIYELNRNKIKGPNKLKVGQKIIIPIK